MPVPSGPEAPRDAGPLPFNAAPDAPVPAAYDAVRRRVFALAGGGAAALMLGALPRRPAHADPTFDLQNERVALRLAAELVEMNADFFSRVGRSKTVRAEDRQNSIINLAATQDQQVLLLLRMAVRQAHALNPGGFAMPNALSLEPDRIYTYPAGTFDNSARAFAFGTMLKDTSVGALHGTITFFQTRALLETAAALAGVQGRHAALLREVSGAEPFPAAFETALNSEQVMQRLAEYGFTGGALRS